MADEYETHASSLISPAYDAQPIVPDSAFDTCRSIWVGQAGNVSVITKAGNTRVFEGAQAGSVIPIRATQVTSVNTTASALLALY